MLRQADAALLIGDPALLALEYRKQIEPPSAPANGSTWPTSGTPVPASPGSPQSGPFVPNPSASATSPPPTHPRPHRLPRPRPRPRRRPRPRVDATHPPCSRIPSATTSPHNIHYVLTPDCLRDHLALSPIAPTPAHPPTSPAPSLPRALARFYLFFLFAATCLALQAS